MPVGHGTNQAVNNVLRTSTPQQHINSNLSTNEARIYHRHSGGCSAKIRRCSNSRKRASSSSFPSTQAGHLPAVHQSPLSEACGISAHGAQHPAFTSLVPLKLGMRSASLRLSLGERRLGSSCSTNTPSSASLHGPVTAYHCRAQSFNLLKASSTQQAKGCCKWISCRWGCN